MRPMLATSGARVPGGEAWVHEVKWDGMRVLVDIRSGRVRITSRTERDVTVAFPEFVSAAAGLGDYDDLLLDGEAVVLRQGQPSFSALAERFNVTSTSVAQRLSDTAPATLMVFDVLRVAGVSVAARALRERRELLDGAGLGSAIVQVPPVFRDGPALVKATAEQGLEGIISKRVGSPYVAGRRSEDWVKIVHRRTGSFVIGGWRFETDSRDRLGALLLGTPTPAGLIYQGRIGSGLVGKTGAALLSQLRQLPSDHAPFADEVPRAERVGVQWVMPELVADIEYHGISEGNRLRQPSWRGLRTDMTMTDLLNRPSDPAPETSDG